MGPVREFDYVVVGAGSAGCVVAARLSESGTCNVALLEAGGEDDSFWIHVPLGYGKLYGNPKYNWLYESEPELGLAGGKSFQPCGKVLGGTGSINGNIYQRGPREDFDYWRQLGNVGWSYDDVLPYFKKIEDNERRPDQFYGVGGPLKVSNCPRNELGDAFIDAAVQAGYSRNEHGAYNTPQLLQISGIGAADLLGKFNIPVIANLPGVGENLQNHIGIGVKYQCSRPITVNDVVNNPVRRLLAGIQYVLFRKGMLTTTALNAAGMIRSDPASSAPDVKLQLQNWGRVRGGSSKGRMGLDPLSCFTVTMQLMHPDHRGTVRIRDSDSAAAPEIRFNYLLSERDQRTVVGGLRAMRKIMARPAIAPYIVQELSGGPQSDTDSDLIDYFRQCAIPGNHATSTCKMGTDDTAVVDPRLRVRSVTRLRVIDASIMPRAVAANPNATTIMIAEKGSAMIIEDAGHI